MTDFSDVPHDVIRRLEDSFYMCFNIPSCVHPRVGLQSNVLELVIFDDSNQMSCISLR